MTDVSFDVSFIIAVPAGHVPTKCLERLAQIDFPLDRMEVILARGAHPSLQRNEAVARAKGRVVYFLDDDSFIEPGSVGAGLAALSESEQVVVVGGPALTHAEGSRFERLIGAVMSSRWGMASAAARTLPTGERRKVNGEELILCNLMIKRDMFLALGGFHEELYPSEEPELMKRVHSAGYEMIYDPDMRVHRTRRKSIASFAKQIYRYGRSRTWHIFTMFTPKDALFFAPLIFWSYLAALPWLHVPGRFLPLALYAAGTGIAAVGVAARERSAGAVPTAARAAVLLVILHLSYALGFGAGLLFGKDARAAGVVPVDVVGVDVGVNVPVKQYAAASS